MKLSFVLAIDDYVFLGQVATPANRFFCSGVEVNRDIDQGTDQGGLSLGFFKRLRCSGQHEGQVFNIDVGFSRVEDGSAATGGGENPAPVGVAAKDRRLG